MAEHRRVETRGIVGTGMTTDPERIREVEEDAERKKRAWRNAPEKGFGEVLEEAPSKGELADEEDPRDPRGRRKKPALPAAAPSETALAEAALAGSSATKNSAATPAPIALDDPAHQNVDAKNPGAKAALTDAIVAPKKSEKALPRVPKDPREAQLRKMLEANQNKPQSGFDVNTPPTGSRSRKPT